MQEMRLNRSAKSFEITLQPISSYDGICLKLLYFILLLFFIPKNLYINIKLLITELRLIPTEFWTAVDLQA